jgi:hypothetical protein
MKLLPSGIVAVTSTLSSLDNLVAEDGQDKPKPETVLNNGPPEKRFDLLFIPEKYSKDQQKDFDKDVDALVAGFDKFDVTKEYKSFFNVHKVWAPTDSERKLSEVQELGKSDLPCVIVNDKSFGHGTGNLVLVRCRNDVSVFFHELGHGLRLDDEYRLTSFMGGGNTCKDKKNIPWKELVDKKIKGIGVYSVEDSYFRAEEKPCLMQTTEAGIQYGPLCSSLIITRLRKRFGLIDEATKEEAISKDDGQQTGIELKLLASKSYIPQVSAFYLSGSADELDSLHDKLKGKKLTLDSFADKKYKKATISTKKNVATITDKLPVGSHLIAVVAKDPNPAILMDPDKVTYDQRIYRVDVTEKK